MEQYSATVSAISEDIRHERSLILLLALVEPDILTKSKFTDDEIEIIKNLALEKLYRQRILKEHVAMDLLEKTIFRSISQYHIITKFRILTIIMFV